jgi:hypothetical protein
MPFSQTSNKSSKTHSSLEIKLIITGHKSTERVPNTIPNTICTLDTHVDLRSAIIRKYSPTITMLCSHCIFKSVQYLIGGGTVHVNLSQEVLYCIVIGENDSDNEESRNINICYQASPTPQGAKVSITA